MIRPPAVAGRFYSDDAEELRRQVQSFCAPQPGAPPQRAIACMVPHAGYRFSGHVAGAVYPRIDLPRRILLLGPRHFPHGASQAILSEGAWQTPLGNVRIDSALAADLKRACPSLTEDAAAHAQEHSLEVQLPFLQVLLGDFRFVPIVLGTVDFAALQSLGLAIAEVLAQQPEPVLIVASSDMNHYESDAITRVKDHTALAPILAMDPRALHDTVLREGITMCGMGPAVSMLTAAQALGAKRAQLVRYATSGDINGDRDEVVGYAGVIVT
jgi:hypothetical protein